MLKKLKQLKKEDEVKFNSFKKRVDDQFENFGCENRRKMKRLKSKIASQNKKSQSSLWSSKTPCVTGSSFSILFANSSIV